MYRSVFTVDVAVTSGGRTRASVLTNYSYINVTNNIGRANFIARCMTGLGPNGTGENANGALGGLYFNGTMIRNVRSCSNNMIVQPEPASLTAGFINIHRCRPLTTDYEGVYTCTMMNSSMTNQSVRFGMYFSGRSESLDLYISSLNHLSSLYTAAPVIDTPSSSTVTVNVGDPLTLCCTSRGSPPDTFTWQRAGDSTVLQSSIITAVDHTNMNAEFRANYSIANVTTSDSGTYTCNVTNPIGTASATITVKVISKFLF